MQHLARQTDVLTDGTVDLTSDTVADSMSVAIHSSYN